MTNPMTDGDYVSRGGCQCPFCYSEDIEGSSFEVDCGRAWQEMSCCTCESEWVDLYTLQCYEAIAVV